jgi:hypothetical protein
LTRRESRISVSSLTEITRSCNVEIAACTRFLTDWSIAAGQVRPGLLRFDPARRRRFPQT